MPRIALNGLGRIGKLVLRDLVDSGAGGEIVLLNDPVGDARQHALLMEFELGPWPLAHTGRGRRGRAGGEREPPAPDP